MTNTKGLKWNSNTQLHKAMLQPAYHHGVLDHEFGRMNFGEFPVHFGWISDEFWVNFGWILGEFRAGPSTSNAWSATTFSKLGSCVSGLTWAFGSFVQLESQAIIQTKIVIPSPALKVSEKFSILKVRYSSVSDDWKWLDLSISF